MHLHHHIPGDGFRIKSREGAAAQEDEGEEEKCSKTVFLSFLISTLLINAAASHASQIINVIKLYKMRNTFPRTLMSIGYVVAAAAAA